MKDNPLDADSPIWTAEDFAKAVPADEALPSRLAGLLVRAPPAGLKSGLSGQPPLARGLRLAA